MTCPVPLSKLRTAPSTAQVGSSSHAPGHQEWTHSTLSLSLRGLAWKRLRASPRQAAQGRGCEWTRRVSSGQYLKAIVLHIHASQGRVAASGLPLPRVLPLLGGPSGCDRCLLHYPSSQVSRHHQRPWPEAEAASPSETLPAGCPCPPAKRQGRGRLTAASGPGTHVHAAWPALRGQADCRLGAEQPSCARAATVAAHFRSCLRVSRERRPYARAGRGLEMLADTLPELARSAGSPGQLDKISTGLQIKHGLSN